jgi:PIF1-like helicase/Helitron helicase-like domain at N-terminus
MEQDGVSTIWYSWSAADNHWQDLHKALDPVHESRPFSNETDKAKFRRKMARNNPLLVNEYFFRRLEMLLESFFSKNRLESEWRWLRGELQKRGVFHGHGCTRLKLDPGLIKLGKEVHAGRYYQKVAEKNHISLPDGQFTPDQTKDDDWHADTTFYVPGDVLADRAAYSEYCVMIRGAVTTGIRAHGILVAYQDFLLHTVHPGNPLPIDANAEERDPNSFFQQTGTSIHPAAREHGDPAATSGDLLSAVNRHLCNDYCKSCRFDYPKTLCESTHIAIKEYKKKEETKAKIEMVSKRNDRWLNDFMIPAMDVWRANFDMRLTIDLGKIIGYMTKYMTKAEMGNTKQTQKTMKAIVSQGLAQGQSTVQILRKQMGKLLGEQIKSKDECCMMIIGQSIIQCSHTCIKVDLQNKTRLLDPGDDDDNDGGDDDGGEINETTGGRRTTGRRATRRTLIDAYMIRMDKTSWCEPNEYDAAVTSGLDMLNLQTFCKHYYVGKSKGRKNKIKQHASHKKKKIVSFWPRESSDPNSDTFTDYCRYSLMQHKPWQGPISNLWRNSAATNNDDNNNDDGDDDDDDDHDDYDDDNEDSVIRKAWLAYMKELEQEGVPLPTALRMAIEKYSRHLDGDGLQAENLGGPVAAALERDDWMLGADISEDYFQDSYDPHACNVRWDPNFPMQLTQDYSGNNCPINDVTAAWRRNMRDEGGNQRAAKEPTVQLNECQERAVDIVLGSIDQGGKLVMLLGKAGTGKSTTINAIQWEVDTLFEQGATRLTATTGRAGMVIGGSTVHSTKSGLVIPVGNKGYKPLSSQTKMKLQREFRHAKVLVLDEFSMLRQKELFWMNKRLQEIMKNKLPFGGLVVVLSGDCGQIPAVRGRVLWDQSKRAKQDDVNGLQTYTMYAESVVELERVERVDQAADDAALFTALQLRLRDGEATEDDYNMVINNCSQHTMTRQQWKTKFVDDINTTYLFCSNKEVLEYNHDLLMKLNNPIVLIEAKNTGRAKNMSSDQLYGLECALFLAVGAKVVITSNVAQHFGLCNGTTGVVKDIVYDKEQQYGRDNINTTTSGTARKPPGLPEYVWVDVGNDYKGPMYFPGNEERRGWVPVHPMTASEYTASSKDSGALNKNERTMLPLRLAWAWTIWKAQGQTFTTKIVLNLGRYEREHGLTYVGFSSATRLSLIGIQGGLTLE